MDWVYAAILLTIGNFVAWMVAMYVNGATVGLIGHVIVSIAGAFIAGYLVLYFAPHYGALGVMAAAFVGSPLLLYLVRFKRWRRN